MKKMLSMMLIMASIVCLFSCSSDDEEERPNIPTNRYMKVGESFDLGYESNWVSSNTFSVAVDNSGVVSGVRKGTANVYSRDKNLSCYISVSPSYTLYDEPITNWGTSKSSVLSEKGEPDSDGETTISYYTNSSVAPIEMYLFENGRLEASAIAVKTSCSEELVKHLSQRFKAVGVDTNNYNFSFMDAESLSDAKTVVVGQLYNTTYWLVMYMPNTNTRSANSDSKLFEAILSNFKLNGDILE